MKLVTLRIGAKTTAARIEGDTAVALAAGDVGALQGQDDWRAIAAADGQRHPV